MSKLIDESPLRPFSSSFTVNGPLRSRNSRRWAVILAGGEGTRLKSLTRMIAGDDRPKQFCKVLGEETLLDQTVRRAALAVPPAQALFVLTQAHEPFYKPLLGGVASEQLVVQPRNIGTAPAILYSLSRLAHVDSTSSVAFFPSDHYFSDDLAFMAHVESAFAAAHARDDQVILLGIKPEGPEGEYGWIEPVLTGIEDNTDALCRVRRFWEKPTSEVARRLMARSCLWNSFVMVAGSQLSWR
jgi:mannose-1-phosphate guanylyltransferase